LGVASARTAPDPGQAHEARWDILLGLAVRHPGLLPNIHEAFALLAAPPQHRALHAALLDLPTPVHDAAPLDTEGAMNHLRSLGLAAVAAQALRAVARLLPAPLSGDASPAEVEATWWHFFGLMDPTRLDDEIARARVSFEACADSPSLRRLTALVEARAALRRGETGLDDVP
jgi:hypothetical protein